MNTDIALLVSIFLWLVICLTIIPLPHIGKDRDEDT